LRGNLEKMRTTGTDPVQYELSLGGSVIAVNPLLGKKIKIIYLGKINCVVCGNPTKKSYGQGLCFTCFSESPENSECIVRPELCEAHMGRGRDPQWEFEHHMGKHFVYLALVSEVKVGVTRDSQIPTRWIDQGAWKSIILAETPYRQLAGKIEVFLKDHLSDRTNIKKMLRGEIDSGVDLEAAKRQYAALLPEDLKTYISANDVITEIQYPVISNPKEISTISFDKQAEVSGVFCGIKGQYLIFESGSAINIRSHSGYLVEIEVH
jgi:hypothetical protein